MRLAGESARATRELPAVPHQEKHRLVGEGVRRDGYPKKQGARRSPLAKAVPCPFTLSTHTTILPQSKPRSIGWPSQLSC